MQGQEIPELTLGKEIVRGRTAADSHGERIAITPDVKAVGMHTQRQIEVPGQSPRGGLAGKLRQLLMDQPLDVQVILEDSFVVIARSQLCRSRSRSGQFVHGRPCRTSAARNRA